MSDCALSVNMVVWRPHPVYFRRAVESLLTQTLNEFELVIVEDPSDMSGAKIIADLAADPRIRYIHNASRTGLVAQRNRALELSRGNWIAVLDADDVAKPDRLCRQLEAVTRDSAVSVLSCALEIIDSDDRVIGLRRYPTEHARIARAMRRYNPVAQPSVMFQRSAALAVGGYQGAPFTEDYDLWCRMLNAGCRFANLSEPLVSYRIHGSASKSAQLRPVLRQTIEIKRRHFAKRFTLPDLLRLFAERVLLLLPPPLVYRLFCTLTYRHRMPLLRNAAIR